MSKGRKITEKRRRKKGTGGKKERYGRKGINRKEIKEENEREERMEIKREERK